MVGKAHFRNSKQKVGVSPVRKSLANRKDMKVAYLLCRF